MCNSLISAIATVTAYPNGHLMPMYATQSNRPPSPSEGSGVIPMRPVQPRTQYQIQYGSQGPPRVNAGDISQASGKCVRCGPCVLQDFVAFLFCHAVFSVLNSYRIYPKCLETWPHGYKTFFKPSSARHEIFSADKYENANNSWHFHIY